MRATALLVAASFTFAPVTIRAEYTFDFERATAIYRAVASGQRDMNSLSPEEQTDLLLMAKLLRSGDCDDESDCCDAREQADSAAGDLESAAHELARCAAGRDFDDDCSSEARRVRSNHDDYESAVSDVSSYCD